MSRCEICGRKKEDDLFMAVANEPVCSVCVADLGGIPSPATVKMIREKLGLEEGEYYQRSDDETRKVLLGALGRL